MAEANGQEKTEQPTGKRRRDARKKGNIFQSKDIVTIIMLFGVFWMLQRTLGSMSQTMGGFMKTMFTSLDEDPETVLSVHLAAVMAVSFLKCALPLLLTAMALAFLSHGIQTKFNVSFSSLKPNFGKMNPISGIKKMFALRNLMELVKNLIKTILLTVLLINLFKADIVPISRMVDMDVMSASSYMFDMIFSLVRTVCMAFAVVAFFDYLYKRWDYEQNLKMTKQEVKEEFKQQEGNPEIKGRIRRIQRQMAMSRMIQKVPEADVIIRNPTHFAVALKYDPDKMAAPLVVAKGQDDLALRIVKAGEESGVFVLENRPLAQALYRSCEIDREIPAEFYGAVAEILVYIYRTSHREDKLR